MRIRYLDRVDGPGPDEVTATVVTAGGGYEELFVHASRIDAAGVEVARVGGGRDIVLVEAPRETARGSWRFWVPADAVVAG